nr:MAG TPA: hypothetical protein [Caudoviricetes sp.]
MKKIKNINSIANGAGIVSSLCVGFVVGKVIGSALPTNMSLVERIVIMIGVGSIGSYIGDKVGNFVEDDTKITLKTINDMLPEEKELYASQEFHTL